MKISFLFLFAIVCIALFESQMVEANKGGNNNIVVKDGHVIVSSQNKKGKGGSNIVIKDDQHGHGHSGCCSCGHGGWSGGSSWW